MAGVPYGRLRCPESWSRGDVLPSETLADANDTHRDAGLLYSLVTHHRPIADRINALWDDAERLMRTTVSQFRRTRAPSYGYAGHSDSRPYERRLTLWKFLLSDTSYDGCGQNSPQYAHPSVARGGVSVRTVVHRAPAVHGPPDGGSRQRGRGRRLRLRPQIGVVEA